ncbi:MAG: VanZ family protein [bacterium]
MLDTPPRESRVVSWLLACAWAVVIYTAVPFARRIQLFVSDHWGRKTFIYIVLAVLVLAGIKACLILARRRFELRWWNAGCLLAVGLAYGVFAINLRDAPEEALHLVEYGGLSLLVFRALSHRVHDPSIYATAWVITVIFGIGDELLQFLVPARYWDFRDIAINASAAALMQVALAGGLRPRFVARRVRPEGMVLLCRAALVLLAILTACSTNTPPRMAWVRAHAPFDMVRRIDDIMIEYGHCFRHPEAGVVTSRMTPDELLAFDRDHAAETARTLEAYQGKRYPTFFRNHLSWKNPFLYEARVRLFRRDFHLNQAIRDRGKRHELHHHATIAYHEQQILDAWFSNTVAQSSYRWPPEIMVALQTLVVDEKPYVTQVSRHLICSFSERQLMIVLAAALLVVGLLQTYYARRKS